MDKFFILDRDFTGQLSENLDDYPNGIVIPLNKPYGWTSADAVRKIKFRLQKHFHKKNIKVGHAGTLDPLATGILLICIGKATKVAEELQSHKKEYIATVRLGATTPSFDAEKDIDQYFECKHITINSIEEVLAQFIGTIEQVPPIFSAKLIDGVRAYEIARDGQERELKASTITIDSIDILKFDERSNNHKAVNIKEFKDLKELPVCDESSDLPAVTLRIKCSKGTYIRSIARDLGISLGSGGYLTYLQRSRSGEFSIEKSVEFEKILEIF